MAEFTKPCQNEEKVNKEGSARTLPYSQPSRKLFVDSSSNKEGDGTGIMLLGLREERISQAMRFNFSLSNNEAEYEALLVGLKAPRSLKLIRYQCYEIQN